jgi:hypothetical protein
MYVFNSELDYCEHDFAKIKQTFMWNGENPVLDPEQQALDADPDPQSDTAGNPAVSGFASYFYQEDILQIGTYWKDGDLPTGTNSIQLSVITVQWS